MCLRLTDEYIHKDSFMFVFKLIWPVGRLVGRYGPVCCAKTLALNTNCSTCSFAFRFLFVSVAEFEEPSSFFFRFNGVLRIAFN